MKPGKIIFGMHPWYPLSYLDFHLISLKYAIGLRYLLILPAHVGALHRPV
jgi:hypothetical protein